MLKEHQQKLWISIVHRKKNYDILIEETKSAM